MAIPPSPIKKVSAEEALVAYLLGLVDSTKAVFHTYAKVHISKI